MQVRAKPNNSECLHWLLLAPDEALFIGGRFAPFTREAIEYFFQRIRFDRPAFFSYGAFLSIFKLLSAYYQLRYHKHLVTLASKSRNMR